MLSIDLSDAFGSISHAAIKAALKGAGACDCFTEIIGDMYSNTFTQILTSEGVSELIPIKCGIKQGEPASGALFDLVINPASEAAQEIAAQEREYCILALADDVFAMHKDIAELQEIANCSVNFATAIGLTINPQKCFSLHLPGGIITAEQTPTFINGTQVRALDTFDTAPFLGKQLGLFTDRKDFNQKRNQGVADLNAVLSVPPNYHSSSY